MLQHWGLPGPAPLGCGEMCHAPAPPIIYTAFERHREGFFNRKNFGKPKDQDSLDFGAVDFRKNILTKITQLVGNPLEARCPSITLMPAKTFQGRFFFYQIYITPRVLEMCKDTLTQALEKQMTCLAQLHQGCKPSSVEADFCLPVGLWSSHDPPGTRLDPALLTDASSPPASDLLLLLAVNKSLQCTRQETSPLHPSHSSSKTDPGRFITAIKTKETERSGGVSKAGSASIKPKQALGVMLISGRDHTKQQHVIHLLEAEMSAHAHAIPQQEGRRDNTNRREY